MHLSLESTLAVSMWLYILDFQEQLLGSTVLPLPSFGGYGLFLCPCERLSDKIVQSVAASWPSWTERESVTIHLCCIWRSSGSAFHEEPKKTFLSIYWKCTSGCSESSGLKPKELLYCEIFGTFELGSFESFSQVLEQQLCCAAAELPLQIEYDERYFGSGLKTSVMKLVKQGLLGRHPKNGCADESWHYIGEVVRKMQPDSPHFAAWQPRQLYNQESSGL